jgi:hypothetical protein
MSPLRLFCLPPSAAEVQDHYTLLFSSPFRISPEWGSGKRDDGAATELSQRGKQLLICVRGSMESFLDTGHWILDTGYWILDTGYWILEIASRDLTKGDKEERGRQ